MARSSPPSTTSGAWPSAVSTVAPISRSGSAIRSIGRALSDSSPTSSKRPSCPARIPGSRRMRVPALPQSSGPSGGRRPRSPTPSRRTRSPSTSTPAPSARTAAAVERVSAEAPKPSISLVAVGDRAEEQRPVGDRLVAGDREVSAQQGGRLEPHQSSNAGETMTE